MFGQLNKPSSDNFFGNTFSKHLRAMRIMAVSGVVALIVGVILLVTVGWQAALLAFVLIAGIGGLVGFLMALRNMRRAFMDN